MEKIMFPPEFWANLYERGQLSASQRQAFEEALSENEEAINALNTYFSVVGVQKRGSGVVAFQPGNELHIQPIALPEALQQAIAEDDKGTILTWIKGVTEQITKTVSKNYKIVAVPVMAAAVVMVVMIPQGNEPVRVRNIGGLQAVQMEIPTPQAMPSGEVVFTWPEVEGVAAFTLRITDSNLEEVLAQEVSGTSFVLNEDIAALNPDENYFWQLQYTDEDGEDQSFTNVFRIDPAVLALDNE